MSDRDKIEKAIRHIDSSLDVDPWARDIAIDAMKAQLSEEDTTKGTTFDCISRESVYNLLRRECSTAVENHLVDKIRQLPSVQPQYEELTPEKAASEIASGSIMSVLYWLDPMIELKQMGYVICRKK